MTNAVTKILINDQIIGYISSVEKQSSTNCLHYKISIMRLERYRLSELFSRGFVHTHSQKVPIQIVSEENDIEMWRIKNAWFSNDQELTSYTSGDLVFLENSLVEAEDGF